MAFYQAMGALWKMYRRPQNPETSELVDYYRRSALRCLELSERAYKFPCRMISAGVARAVGQLYDLAYQSLDPTNPLVDEAWSKFDVLIREYYAANFPGHSISFHEFKNAAVQRIKRYLRASEAMLPRRRCRHRLIDSVEVVNDLLNSPR